MRDAVQPGAQRELAVVGPQTRVRADEHVLQDVLGVLRGTRKHPPRVCEQPLAVAVVDHPECLVVSGAEQRHELVIGPETEQAGPAHDPAAAEPIGCLER